MYCVFASQNKIYKDENLYSILNLKAKSQKIYYSDNEENFSLEDDYKPKWKKFNFITPEIALRVKESILRNPNDLTCDFVINKKIYICSLSDLENYLYNSIQQLPQPEDTEIATLNFEIEKINNYLNSSLSILYSFTRYNENQRINRSNKEHRKLYLEAVLAKRFQIWEDELKIQINQLRKDAQKYSATHIIFRF